MSEKKESYVELKNVNKSFGGFEASKDININIKKGHLVALLGPSGSGKTTILKMLAGLENADSGDIYIAGTRVNDVKPKDRGIGLVFQSYALFRYKTVYENIAFGLKIEKKDKNYIKKRVNELIELVGLKGMEKRYPRQLSGGQRQRVAFARAIATQPQLLLLDEPFAAIDTKVRKELRGWLRELINEVGITSIVVTHDQEEALELADEIILTNHGKVEQTGTPSDIYNNPKTLFAAAFLGDNSVIENISEFKGFEGIPGKAVIRPEFVNVYAQDESIEHAASVDDAVVSKVVFKGNIIELKLNIKGSEITAYRNVGQKQVIQGENVKVFIRKVFEIDDTKASSRENSIYSGNDSIVI